jgi:hypothetical protein
MSAATYVTDTEMPFATVPMYGSSHSQEERYVKASSPLYDRMRKSIGYGLTTIAVKSVTHSVRIISHD